MKTDCYPYEAMREYMKNSTDLFSGPGSGRLAGILTQHLRRLTEEGALPGKIETPAVFDHASFAQTLRLIQREIASHEDRPKNAQFHGEFVSIELTLIRLRQSLHHPARKSCSRKNPYVNQSKPKSE